MSSITIGAGVAAAVAGWPLYTLVSSGQLDATDALVRGGVVTLGCVLGVAAIGRLADGYAAQLARERRLAARDQGVVHEGTPLPPQGDH